MYIGRPTTVRSMSKKNDAHVASAPADLVALKACALASSIIFLDIDFIDRLDVNDSRITFENK